MRAPNRIKHGDRDPDDAMWVFMTAIAIVVTFVLTATTCDRQAEDYERAAKACEIHASGTKLMSFDTKTATCANGAKIDY